MPEGGAPKSDNGAMPKNGSASAGGGGGGGAGGGGAAAGCCGTANMLAAAGMGCPTSKFMLVAGNGAAGAPEMITFAATRSLLAATSAAFASFMETPDDLESSLTRATGTEIMSPRRQVRDGQAPARATPVGPRSTATPSRAESEPSLDVCNGLVHVTTSRFITRFGHRNDSSSESVEPAPASTLGGGGGVAKTPCWTSLALLLLRGRRLGRHSDGRCDARGPGAEGRQKTTE